MIEASPFDKVIRMIKELGDELPEQVIDEATQKDWCSTELSKNEQSCTTLADDASNLKNLNDVHVAEIFSAPRATTESHRFGLTPGMVFDIRTGWNLDDPRKLKQLWEYLRTSRPMLVIGSSECKAISNVQSLNRDSPNLPLPLTSEELGVYRIEVPPQTQAKKVKVRAKLTLHGTFVVEAARTVGDEEYEETVKEKRELPAEPVPEMAETAEGSATAEPNGVVTLQDLAESGDGDGKKEAPPGPREPEKKYEWVEFVKKRERKKRTDLTVISSGVPGLSADILQKGMDEETGMQSEMRNSIELDEKFYINFAQFEQRQKEMDRNTMKTINVRTDQSKRKIVIRTPPEDAAQCFDVACENAMAKMGFTIGLFSPCLYLHKTENEADDVAKSQSVYDTMRCTAL